MVISRVGKVVLFFGVLFFIWKVLGADYMIITALAMILAASYELIYIGTKLISPTIKSIENHQKLLDVVKDLVLAIKEHNK